MIEAIKFNGAIAYRKDFNFLGLHFTASLQKSLINDSYDFLVWNGDDYSSDDIFTIEGINKNKVNVFYFNKYLDRFLNYIS